MGATGTSPSGLSNNASTLIQITKSNQVSNMHDILNCQRQKSVVRVSGAINFETLEMETMKKGEKVFICGGGIPQKWGPRIQYSVKMSV